MTILLLQTFLLLLAAFLLGASLACLLRRAISGRGEEEALAAAAPGLGAVAVPSASQSAVSGLGSDRFGRALSGEPGVPPVFHGQAAPVVEVQPKPQAPKPAPVQPVSTPVPSQPALQPAPAPPRPVIVAPVAPQPQPRPVPPAVVTATPIAPPKPVIQVTLAPAPKPAPAPQPSTGPSYASVAAAAAAAAAKADAEAKAAASAAESSRYGSPVTETEATRPAVTGPLDDLTRIIGIDADTKERLIRYGVHTFAAIAAWTPEDIRGVNQSFGYQGRVERENWVEQARILVAKVGEAAQAPKHAVPLDVKAPVDGERLHRVIGIDPNSELLLQANGVKRIADIAAWSAADVARFEGLIGVPGRITRESWVEQARFLVHGVPAKEPTAADLPPVASQPWPSVVVPSTSQVPPAQAPATASAPSVAPKPAAPAPASSVLRSVRSEALRGGRVGALFSTSGEPEDLKRIRGIGVMIEKKLHSLGVATYEQIANWTRGDIDRVSDMLDFKGRIERENWIEQARILASGGQTEFSRRADRGEA